MDFRIIKSPSEGVIDVITRRKSQKNTTDISTIDAIGLVQGKLLDMICAADVAEKSAGVTVADISGSCPQNMIVLAIFGDTASVVAAIDEIKRRYEEGKEPYVYRKTH